MLANIAIWIVSISASEEFSQAQAHFGLNKGSVTRYLLDKLFLKSWKLNPIWRNENIEKNIPAGIPIKINNEGLGFLG